MMTIHILSTPSPSMHMPTPLSHPTSSHLSFSSALPSLPLRTHLRRTTLPNPSKYRVHAVFPTPPQELPRDSLQKLLKELAERKKAAFPKKRPPPKKFILRPPLDDAKLAERFLNSPQLSLKQFPLLSSRLPTSRLNNADRTWIDEYLLEAKQALGYPLKASPTTTRPSILTFSCTWRSSTTSARTPSMCGMGIRGSGFCGSSCWSLLSRSIICRGTLGSRRGR